MRRIRQSVIQYSAALWWNPAASRWLAKTRSSSVHYAWPKLHIATQGTAELPAMQPDCQFSLKAELLDYFLRFDLKETPLVLFWLTHFTSRIYALSRVYHWWRTLFVVNSMTSVWNLLFYWGKSVCIISFNRTCIRAITAM